MAVNILVGIVGVLILAIIFIVLSLIIWLDIKSAQTYKNAFQVTGTIKKNLKDTYICAYGSGISGIGKRRRWYRQYEVEYQVNGITYVGLLQTKEKTLTLGDTVEVRYIWKENSREPELATRVYADRIKQLGLGAIGAIILSIGIMFYLSYTR